jgi:hypothetical protein
MTIPAEQILDGYDIRRIGGGVTRATLDSWRRHPSFPAPFKVTGSGVRLYDQRRVLSWLDRFTVVGPRANRHLRYREGVAP